ncbi:MAG: hypothetical protein EZS28_001537, partial [Streblomastix strix]
TEEVNQENDQDQEFFQDLKTTKIRQKLEWMLIGIKMDLKLETNQEAEHEEHIDERNIVIKEGDRTIKTEINRIRKDIEKHRSITHIQNRSSVRLRIQQTETGSTNMIIGIDEKAWSKIQMTCGQNAHRCRKIHLNTIVTKTQPGQKMQPLTLGSNSTTQIACSTNTTNIIGTSNTKIIDPSSNTKIKKGRKDQPPNQDDIDEQEIKQERLATLQREKEQYNISDSDNELQQIIEEIDNNNLAPKMISTRMNKDKPSSQIQRPEIPTQETIHRGRDKQRQQKMEREGTVGQLTGLQPSSGAQNPGLNAGLKPIEARSISASNSKRTESQMNEGHDDNAEDKEDEQTVKATLIQNKDCRVNIISQPPVQENLSLQLQNIQGFNALSQINKDNRGPAPVGVQEKPKKGKGSKSKILTKSLIAVNEPSQGSNAQTST